MYSRPSSRDFRVPTNYGGSAFRDNTPTQAEDLTRRHQSRVEDTPESERCENCPKVNAEKEEMEEMGATEQKDRADAPKKAEGAENSLFSPLGALGSEEILLIALALIIFQSGKEPELALILLALLFIN